MLHRVALVRTGVSEELSASFIRVTGIGELGTTLAVTSSRRTLRRNCLFVCLCFSGAVSRSFRASGDLLMPDRYVFLVGSLYYTEQTSIIHMSVVIANIMESPLPPSYYPHVT
jgi:hypothetical protein